MGVAVFSGMLGVTFFGLVLTPVFYVVLQGVVERRVRAARQFAVEPAHDEESKHV
jgi:multidrug efflux pump